MERLVEKPTGRRAGDGAGTRKACGRKRVGREGGEAVAERLQKVLRSFPSTPGATASGSTPTVGWTRGACTPPFGKGGRSWSWWSRKLQRLLETPAAAASVSSATTIAFSPTAAAVKPAAAVVAVVAPAVSAAVAAPAEKAVVAGARADVRPVTPTPAFAAAAKKVDEDAEDYAYRDNEQGHKEQFHGTILPLDVPGCKVCILPARRS